MQIWQAVILGAVQGLCEFLPVSSSGHLILVKRWLGVGGGGIFFDVVLHLGTLVPVCAVFSKQIAALFKKPFDKLALLVLSSVPAAITGFLLGDAVEGAFYAGNNLSAILLSVSFILTAAEMFFAGRAEKRRKESLPLGIRQAAAMGVAQGLAIVPGLSRSGTVIFAGCLSGLKKEENAEFAFLMSIPVILGAALVSGIKAIGSGEARFSLPLLFGLLSAATTGYIAIKVMLKAIKKADYKAFGFYLLAAAALSVATKFAFGA